MGKEVKYKAKRELEWYEKGLKAVVIEFVDVDKFVEGYEGDLGTFNVHKNHDHSIGLIGVCHVQVKHGVMYGDFELHEDCNGLYPSIGYQMLTDKKYKLMSIGLCENPNEDERIRPLNY